MTSLSTDILHWGILGCANIARKNITAINASRNCKLIAIASRRIDKAQAYANELNLSSDILLYDYNELLDDNRIQAVYIPLPTVCHMEWVSKAANAKKHILIEKPVAICASDFQEMIAICAKNNVLLMDGTMFMHHPRTMKLRELLDSDEIGAVRRVRADFSFKGDREFFQGNIRVKADGDPLGAIGDLGWYCARLGLLVYSPHKTIRYPLSCRAICTQWTDDKVPLDVECLVFFGEDQTEVLSFSASFMLPLRQGFEICCTAGSSLHGDEVLQCDDFVLPTSPTEARYMRDISPSEEMRERSSNLSHSHVPEICSTVSEQQVLMFEEFATTVLCNEKNSGKYWAQIALATQAIMDACYTSMKEGGITVPVENYLEHFI